MTKKDFIFDGNIFIAEHLNPQNSECKYCGMSFLHQHQKGHSLKEYIKINLLAEATWKGRFEKEFCDRNIMNVLCWKFKFGEEIPSPKDILDFISREFI